MTAPAVRFRTLLRLFSKTIAAVFIAGAWWMGLANLYFFVNQPDSVQVIIGLVLELILDAVCAWVIFVLWAPEIRRVFRWINELSR